MPDVQESTRPLPNWLANKAFVATTFCQGVICDEPHEVASRPRLSADAAMKKGTITGVSQHHTSSTEEKGPMFARFIVGVVVSRDVRVCEYV